MAILRKVNKEKAIKTVELEQEESNLSLPFTLPFTINSPSEANTSSAGFSLPFSIPFYLGTSDIDDNYNIDTYPMKENAWRFYGILFDENIVAAMHKQLTLIEEIKSRILVDMYLIDRNHLRIKWSGSPVDYIQVYKKLDIDDKYEADELPIAWDKGGTTIAVGDGSYNIQLRAPNGSGESNIIELFDTAYIKTKTDLKIAINEKTYYFELDLKQTFEIDVNF